MNQHIFIEDDSGDKKYFTIVPNYIINHSTAIDQALYLNMKRYAGEVQNGICYASEKTFRTKMSIGRVAFKKSLNYLLDHKWITDIGYKKVQTEGGVQNVRAYKINDLWKLNIEHYEGVVKTAPLDQRGVQNDIKGVLIQRTKKNKREEEQYSNASVAGVEINEIIFLFKEVNPMIEKLYGNKSQRAAIERMLKVFGRAKVEEMIKILPRLNSMQYYPKSTTPVQLENNIPIYKAKKEEAQTPQKSKLKVAIITK